jgi:multidrug efflux pump subunit AcrB
VAACCFERDDSWVVGHAYLKILCGGDDASRNDIASDGVSIVFAIAITITITFSLSIAVIVAITFSLGIAVTVTITFSLGIAVTVAITFSLSIAVTVAITFSHVIHITNSHLPHQRHSDGGRPAFKWCQSHTRRIKVDFDDD